MNQQAQQGSARSMDSLMRECLRNCLECHRICTESVAHVMHGGGAHNETEHLVALLDCAQMCALHAEFMARGSPHHTHLARECAEICNACAALCEKHADPDGEMQACAEACRRCADPCSRMVA